VIETSKAQPENRLCHELARPNDPQPCDRLCWFLLPGHTHSIDRLPSAILRHRCLGFSEIEKPLRVVSQLRNTRPGPRVTESFIRQTFPARSLKPNNGKAMKSAILYGTRRGSFYSSQRCSLESQTKTNMALVDKSLARWKSNRPLFPQLVHQPKTPS